MYTSKMTPELFWSQCLCVLKIYLELLNTISRIIQGKIRVSNFLYFQSFLKM